ncbi:hypothetical protein CRE_02328 [Caenorhabditis remanei]|uniref:Uncharacterized protein n=1 Tax=Caenorhabditis remanei TaxID=31234 RepID=E3MIH6_CAERE|nr:hypothetical protein CRE_02328 [Caenorhabditis remanei]
MSMKKTLRNRGKHSILLCRRCVESFREDLSKKYRNTGSQSRRFIQEMKRRLEDVIDENTIDDVIQDFRTTVVNKNAQKFAEMETAVLHEQGRCEDEASLYRQHLNTDSPLCLMNNFATGSAEKRMQHTECYQLEDAAAEHRNV